MSDFRNIKAGDVVTRMLAGVIPMKLKVTTTTNALIICGPWEFDRASGVEIDDEISVQVSHLIHEEELK